MIKTSFKLRNSTLGRTIMRKIYILGSINTDLVINTPYIPNKGETLMGSDFFTAHGGKGANQAVAAARSETIVNMCGCVGDDIFGQSALESLKKEGINCEHIRAIKNTPTGTAVIIVCGGDNRIILDSGANAKIDEKQIDDFLKSANADDIFLAQLENPIDLIGYGLKKAKEKEMMVVLNPAPANKEVIKYLKYVDVLTPNEGECELLGGEENLIKTVNTLIITLGSKGFKIVNNKQSEIYPCIKIKPVDTTAAGDTFCGAMLASYARTGDLVKSALYGSLAASIACTKKGAQPSVPTRKEIESYSTKK